MEIEDGRAFRPHLAGRDLVRAQEKLIAAVLRGPSLAPTVRVAGLDRKHVDPELRPVFEFAIRSDRDQIRRAVSCGNSDAARLYRSGVEIGHGQVLQLARQIKESVDRDQQAQMQASGARRLAARKMTAFEVPLTVAVSATAIGVMPVIAGTEPATEKPATASNHASSKPVGIGKAAATAFLREVLAHGPVAARKIEGLAIEAGLLAEGTSVGNAKVFRTARSALKVKSYQPRGRKSGGWFWALPAASCSPCSAAWPSSNAI